MKGNRLFAACLSGVTLAATAAPMAFSGSQMVMGDFGTNWREAWVNHAFTPRDALGAGGLYMRSDDHQTTREIAELTYTRLLSRWNLPHAQANAWRVVEAGVPQWRNRSAPCPLDPALRSACLRLRSLSRRVYLASVLLFAIGGWFAFVQPRLSAAG